MTVQNLLPRLLHSTPVLLTLFFSLMVVSLAGQTAEGDPIHSAVDTAAAYPGGQAEMMKWLSGEIQYPEGESRGGTVFCTFVVEKDGSLSHIELMRGMGAPYDDEVIRVLSTSPLWTPAVKDGQPVRSQQTLPVRFQARKGTQKGAKGDKKEKKK